MDFWDGIMPKDAVLYASDALDDDDTGEALGGFARHKYLQVTLEVTGCEGGATADKLDVLVDRSVDGALWTNALHFPQVDGDASFPLRYVMALDRETPDSTPMTDSLDYSADLAENLARPVVAGGYLRARADVTIDSTPDPEWSFSVVVHGE